MRRKAARYLAIIIAIYGIGLSKVQAAPPTLVLYGSDGGALEQSLERYRSGDAEVVGIVHALLTNAENALHDGPYSVVFKKHTIPGIDIHDYVSIAPYTWPNPKTPNHLPYVDRDGERNPEFKDYDALPLMNLTDHAYVLALAGYFSGDRRYSERSAELMRIWFLNPATRMNPNFDHAQIFKGVNEGENGGIIESRRVIMLIDAMQILKQSGTWSDADEAAFRQWLRPFLSWLLTSKLGREESQSMNNHGTWYDVQVVTYSIYLGEDDQARNLLARAEHRMNMQLWPDGEMPFEEARTRSFWYVSFYMEGATQLADIAERVGVDLWHERFADGSSIRRSLEFLIPYAIGEKKWPHEEIGGFTGKALLEPLRRAEAIWPEAGYERDVNELKFPDVMTDEDREHPLFPAGLERIILPATR
ncbi:MAG TPA: alginate lyase family protein [Tepidisphaeraceae bacterium]|nr:alginate lyase family protein [Tepidisphaeraceae bacterium]